MNQTVRYIIFIASSMAIFAGWQYFFPTPQPKPKPHPPTPISTPDAGTPSAPTVTPPPNAAVAPAPGSEPELVAGPAVEVRTTLWTAMFSTRGAGLESFILKPKNSSEKEGRNLAHAVASQPLPLAVDLSSLPGFGPDAIYKAEPQVAGKQELVFTRTRGGITVTKRFTYKLDSYQLGLELSVTGAPAGTLSAKVLYTADEPPPPSSSMFSLKARPEPHASVCLLNGERAMTVEQFLASAPVHALEGQPLFTGIDEKYFITAMSPGADPAPSTCEIGNVTPADHRAVLTRALTVANGAAATSFDIFIGPKDSSVLSAFDHSLSKSIDFGYKGFLNIICDLLLWVLKMFHTLVGNWGVAIILLTIVMKLATVPLTHKQMLSMEEGKKLNPLVEKLKVKYAGDNTRIQMETMKLYKEHNYQPLAGCFPMLIQMPVWFALYSVLGASYELYKQPFIGGWISDLTAHDPFFALPIAMTLTMVINQKLTPQAAATNEQAEQMQKMMVFMPIVFGFIMMTLPAGLVLYNFTSTLLGIGQSLYFRRKFAAPVAAK